MLGAVIFEYALHALGRRHQKHIRDKNYELKDAFDKRYEIVVYSAARKSVNSRREISRRENEK